MKFPLAALAICYAFFFGCLFATLGKLPDTVASHFDAAGRANGWMARGSYLEFTIGMAIGLPVFMAGITLLSVRMGRGLNIPNRDYWLAPERRQATLATATQFVIALAAIVVLLVACVHLLVVSANADAAQPRMNFAGTWAVLAGFLAATAAWIWLLRRRFSRLE
jgi:hypothetical protein